MTMYPILVDVEPESGSVGVIFPGLPGCTAMGDTLEEALQNAKEAFADWVLQSKGTEIPAPLKRESVLSDPEYVFDFSSGSLLFSLDVSA